VSFPATYLDIQTSVAQKLRMNLTDDGDKIRGYIATTYAEVAAETRCFQRTGTTTMAAPVPPAIYTSCTLDPSVLHIELLTVTQDGGTAWFPLKECQLDEILNYRAVASASGGPPTRYALIGLNQIELWPNARTGDVLTTWYSYLPTPLSDDTDVPAIPEPYASNLLEYGACVQGAEFKRDIMMLGDFQSQYAQALQNFQKYLNRKAGAYPGAFPTWTRMNPFAPHDPSTDVPGWDWSVA
jgi:hypothetical protein